MKKTKIHVHIKNKNTDNKTNKSQSAASALLSKPNTSLLFLSLIQIVSLVLNEKRVACLEFFRIISLKKHYYIKK